MSKLILKNGSGSLCCKGCGRQDNKLNTYDWMADIPGNSEEQDMVEVQFKNTRKGYFKNSNHLKLEKGDIVAVEASPGHDIGTVTLTGRLVPLQMRKANIKPDAEIRRVYRKAKPVDMEKYEEAKSREHATMIRSRQIAADLGLQMKIGDVEYQGDGNKAIGARQEAGRIGGIGPCGRELCCATWMTNFISVSTGAARYQDISLNPQKLAGQCAKLKCCLNYEVDAYVECQKRLPSKEITLETLDATYYYFKADILKGEIIYSTDKSFLANEVTLTARRAFEVINMNRRGEKPEKLNDNGMHEPARPKDLLEQESVTRFDKSRNSKNRKKKKNGENRQQPVQENNSQKALPNNAAGQEKGENTAKIAVNATTANNVPSNSGKDNRRKEERQGEKRREKGNRPPKQQGAAPNPSDKQANQPEARAQQPQPEGNKQANNRPRRQGRKNNNEIV